jgi:hypothetical protein
MVWLDSCLWGISGTFLFVRPNECFRNIPIVVFGSSAFWSFAIQYLLDWIASAMDFLLHGELYWMAKIVFAQYRMRLGRSYRTPV